jgi:iron(II)-dependent oxidoreductase
MRRFLPRTLNQWLLAAVPLPLLLAWPTGMWTIGAAISLAALCALAMRNPQHEFLETWPWLRRFVSRSQQSAAGSIDHRPKKVPPSLPPPRRQVRKDKNMSPVEHMLAQGRVALLLRPQIAASLSTKDLELAQAALDEVMAIVPQGPVAVRSRSYDNLEEGAHLRAERLINVEGFFLDRYAVSNREFLEFVEDGGYDQMSLWDEAIWPAVLGFVDQSGQPGPRYWDSGTFRAGHEDHPVVGISWYEACAYARWAGKRLATDPEWVKAGTWPVIADGAKPVQRRFPWGESMDRKRVNVWGSGYGRTIPVHALPAGGSVNGVHQLIGNVWEWTSSTFGAWEPAGRKIETAIPLKSIRGGAYDTYYDAQAHCQFQSGESPLSRKHNIGFRCALGFCDVVGAAEADPHQTDSVPAATHEEVLA